MSFLFSQPAPGVLPANSVDFSEVEKINANRLLGNNLGIESTIKELEVSDVATMLNLASLQPLDSDLTAIAALSPANDDLIQRKAGVWTNRTPAQFKTDLSLTKSDVGLSNVANVDQTNASNISSGTLSISYGGTGQTTANAALNALLPIQGSSANKFLKTDGSNTSWATAGVDTSTALDQQVLAYNSGTGLTTWQYAGLGDGFYPSNTIVLGRELPSGMTSTGTVLIGVGSGKINATGNNNTIIGSGSATSITNSASNVIIGQGAATGITTGGGNCVIGASAGASNNFNGVDSVIIGGSASTSATGTIWATAIGYGARVGDGGVSLGRNTNSSGFYSTCLGHGANTGNGGYSVAIGYYSLAAYGFGANGGTNTVGVGSYTGGGSLTTGFSAFTRCLYLGTYAGSYSSGKTDEFMLDNQDRGSYANTQTRSLMYGTFNSTEGNQTLFINAKQTVRRTTSATSTVTPVLQLDSESSGTPANGIGVSLEMAAETSVGNTEIGVVLEAVTTDVTSTSEDFDLVVKNMAAGATAAETLRVASTGDITAKTGNILIDTAGKGLAIKSGADAKIGVTGAFPGGGTNTVTVNTTAVTTNSIIFISAVSGATTVDPKVWVSTITANTSFVISSGDNSFTGTVGWMIVEATP